MPLCILPLAKPSSIIQEVTRCRHLRVSRWVTWLLTLRLTTSLQFQFGSFFVYFYSAILLTTLTRPREWAWRRNSLRPLSNVRYGGILYVPNCIKGKLKIDLKLIILIEKNMLFAQHAQLTTTFRKEHLTSNTDVLINGKKVPKIKRMEGKWRQRACSQVSIALKSFSGTTHTYRCLGAPALLTTTSTHCISYRSLWW